MNRASDTVVEEIECSKIGNIQFQISHPDRQLEKLLLELLKYCAVTKDEDKQSIKVKFGYHPNISELFRNLVTLHSDFMHVRASCLMTPDGKKVLISGTPNTGKTSLAIALLERHGWRLISDLVALVARNHNEILSFAAPMNVKSGTRKSLASLDIKLPHSTLHEYMPPRPETLADSCFGPFDIAIHLNGGTDTEFVCSPLSTFALLRKVFPISNIAKTAGDDQRFLRYLTKDSCYLFEGGELKTRVEKVLALCNAIERNVEPEINSDPNLLEKTFKSSPVEQETLEIDVNADLKLDWLPTTLLKRSSTAENKIALEDNLLISGMGATAGLMAISKGESPQIKVIDRINSAGLWIAYRSFARAIYCASSVIHLHGNDHVSVIAHPQYKHIHDVRLQFGHLIFVSTGTNEVVLTDSQGEIQHVWKFPGEGDTRHLNCLDLWDGRYVVSCFGRFEIAREFKDKGKGAGVIFDLETDETIWDGLYFPHTPRLHEGKQYVCDSGEHRILRRNCDGSDLQLIHFPGAFTRGIAFGEKHMYLGLSPIRGTAFDTKNDQKDEDGNSREINGDYRQARDRVREAPPDSIKTARLAIIDKTDFKLLDTIDMPCSEIYEILVPPNDVEDSLAFFDTLAN